MEEPLNLTTKIVHLLTVLIQLVDGALNRTTNSGREAADQLRALQRDLDGLEQQVLLVQMNLGVVSTGSRNWRSKKLLRGCVP
jgi:hypothetical protein